MNQGENSPEFESGSAFGKFPLLAALSRCSAKNCKSLKTLKNALWLKSEKFCVLDNGNPSPPAGACLDSVGQFCSDIWSFSELHSVLWVTVAYIEVH